jgi:Holliday junction resolvase
MLEKTIERQLVKEVKKMGGRAVKFVSPGCDGMPDRLVLLPKGRVAFVEVKSPGKKPRALQIARHEMLRNLGFSVYVLDSIEKIGDMLNDIYTA